MNMGYETSAKAVCLDCQAEIDEGQVVINHDPEDHRIGIDVFYANGQLISNCITHHDQKRWGKKSTQHADFLIESADEEPIGTVTVSTEGARFVIRSLNQKIRNVLTGRG